MAQSNKRPKTSGFFAQNSPSQCTFEDYLSSLLDIEKPCTLKDMKRIYTAYLEDLTWAKSQPGSRSKKSALGNVHIENKDFTDSRLSRLLETLKQSTVTNNYHINQAGIVGNPEGPVTINNNYNNPTRTVTGSSERQQSRQDTRMGINSNDATCEVEDEEGIEKDEDNEEDEQQQSAVNSSEIHLSKSKQPSPSTTHSKRFESLFDDDDLNVIPPMNPNVFRHNVYHAALKTLSGDFLMSDIFEFRKAVDSFQPDTIGQHLDKMAATIILNKPKSDMDNITLKLSMSRIVDCMNTTTMAIFQKYLNKDQLWPTSPTSPIISSGGLGVKSRQLFEKLMELGKNDRGFLTKDLLNEAICQMKLDLYKSKSQDQELFQVLDVVMAVVRTCIDDVGAPSKTSSELTFYRKIAHVFDIILDDTNLVQKDGETMSSTSKDICRANAKAFGTKYCLSGRRIDLLIESNDVELSTNEWKKEVPLGMSLKQQSKNVRMNKALLSKWLTYPVTDSMISRLATLSMDWIGNIGYMFSVSPYKDVYVARHFANLEYPLYVADIPDFITTLDALYVWKNHHLDMKDILVPAINKKHQRAYLNNLVYSDNTPSTSTSIHQSPNVLFTPSKRRRTKAVHFTKVDSQDSADDEDANEYDA